MTIRFKITMLAIAVILVANAIFSLVGVMYLERAWQGEVQARVEANLGSARAAYDDRIEHVTSFLRAVSLERNLKDALTAKSNAAVGPQLQEVYGILRMDFLLLLDAEGRVVYRVQNPGHIGDDFASHPLVAQVLQKKESAGGTIVLTGDQLQREGEKLARQAKFDLLPSPAAKPTPDRQRIEGLAIAAAAPIFDSERRLLGVLYGGELLNRRYYLVDVLQKRIFPDEKYDGKEIGTVTIFQGDLRIATNVRLADGARAVGTRMSRAVAEEVLDRGKTWSKPALVVNDWYYTAYEPIRDPAGKIVGALYVGLLKAPFAHRQNVISGVFLLMVSITTIAMLALIYFVTKLVLRPVDKITTMARRVVEGDLSARVEIRPPGEFGVLCRAIDAMADAVAEREEQLKQSTRQQIGRSEKLASIGRLAAGVAHEINNPLTGVLTFAHLLREKPNMDEQDKEDLDLIIRETTRAAEIVRGLLDFSRERPAMMQRLDINEVVRRTVQLIRNQKLFDGIVIRENLTEKLPEIDGDMNRLQQVLLNLTLNSCEAMPEGGTMTIDTSARNGEIRVVIADSGHGIKPEVMDKIFEPFFSTKPVGQGTGLGLAVSYGIIQQHGGSIEVESEEGKGAKFIITLPAENAG